MAKQLSNLNTILMSSRNGFDTDSCIQILSRHGVHFLKIFNIHPGLRRMSTSSPSSSSDVPEISENWRPRTSSSPSWSSSKNSRKSWSSDVLVPVPIAVLDVLVLRRPIKIQNLSSSDVLVLFLVLEVLVPAVRVPGRPVLRTPVYIPI